MSFTSPGLLFKSALKLESPLQIVGAINANHALLAQRAGYEAIYLSGGGVSAGSLGLPDLGISNLDDVLTDARRITDICHLPLLVDGMLTDRVQEFDISNTLFHSCLFNIVAETSSQSEANWRSVFLTEKTWKAVMQRQIPIWFGVPGLVEHVRSLGFDTFDDILGDHQYDTIMDETARHQSVFDLIRQINNQCSLADCQTLRQQLQPRLEANFEQLLQYFRTNRRQISNAILEFDYQTGLTALSK